MSNPFESSRQLSPAESERRLMKLQEELAPIFNESHSTLGHGTATSGIAEEILKNGMYATKAPDLASTAIPLEKSQDGINSILKWPHEERKYIVVIMVPKNVQGDVNKYIWDDLDANDPWSQGAVAKLPPKFIRGYIDVNKTRFISNPNFEDNPTLKIPIVEEKSVLERKAEALRKKGPADIPSIPIGPASNTEVW